MKSIRQLFTRPKKDLKEIHRQLLLVQDEKRVLENQITMKNAALEEQKRQTRQLAQKLKILGNLLKKKRGSIKNCDFPSDFSPNPKIVTYHLCRQAPPGPENPGLMHPNHDLDCRSYSRKQFRTRTRENLFFKLIKFYCVLRPLLHFCTVWSGI